MRKGTWSEEEDLLLRNCIEKYGEGKWHLVPERTGLNRCRKSCRLRWLNYLRPNIKRGDFTVDEVDLITRLQKLLGNRWSLIAGRLPGRTANDVKNYWNVHLLKKRQVSGEGEIRTESQNTAKIKVIKPRPRILSKSLQSLGLKTTMDIDSIQSRDDHCKPSSAPPPALAVPLPPPPSDPGIIWWESVLFDNNGDEANHSQRGLGEEYFASLWEEETAPDTRGDTLMEEEQSFWNDIFSRDSLSWDLCHAGQGEVN